MQEEVGYTIGRAARRAGVAEPTIRLWIKEGKVQTLVRSGRTYVRAGDVERRRAQSLAKFVDVLDVTRSSEGGPTSISQQPQESEVILKLRARVAILEDQLRQVIASRSTVNEGLQLLLRGEQGLLDAVLAGLPAEPADLQT